MEGARTRFRPVVMTTISTAMGAVPLMLAAGAGSESRSVLGVVVFSGVACASIFTLFVVPAFYHLLARHTGSRNAVEKCLEGMASELDAARETGL